MTVYELTGVAGRCSPHSTSCWTGAWCYGPRVSPDDAAQPGWALLNGAGLAALPAGQTCELRVGPEVFYLGSDAWQAHRPPRAGPDRRDAVVTMPAGTLYSLLIGHTTVTGAVRHSTVDGDTQIARRALEPLAAAALTKPAPAI